MDKIEKKIITYLKKYNPQIIYLFGSYIKGNFTDNSDIDIAIIIERSISNNELFEISQELSVLINRDVDIINFINAPLTLRIEVLKYKKILFCMDEEKRIYYEMLTLKEYEKLNEEREIILKNKLGESWMLL